MNRRSRLERPKGFIDYVQAHERVWGDVGYPGRPSLEQILAAPVVVFWRTHGPKPTITIHDSTDDVERALLKLVLRAHIDGSAERRPTLIYRERKRLHIAGVRLTFSE